jgi:hypothetical protein
MTLSSFPAFLTFLTQALSFPVRASDPWQGLEIPSYPGRKRLGPQTVRPKQNLNGRPEFASGHNMVPCWRLPNPCSHAIGS